VRPSELASARSWNALAQLLKVDRVPLEVVGVVYPSRTITCIIPSARAASVLGIGCRCWSADCAVPLRSGVDHDDTRARLLPAG
jgi:hypothetical protein